MVSNYSSAEKNYALCRKELDYIANGNFLSNGYEACQNMQFFKINGISKFWESETDFQFHSLVGDILNSCVRHGVPFAYAVVGDECGISVYVGTMKILQEGLMSSYESSFPGIDITLMQDNPLRTCPREYGGLFTGIPTDKIGAEKKGFQIESICRAMHGKAFSYVVVASGISNIAVTLGHERMLEEMETVFTMINQTISGGAQGNLSAQKQDFNSKNYFENLERLESCLKAGIGRGMWRVNGYYASNHSLDAKRLGNVIKASFSGNQSAPEPFRVMEYNAIRDVLANTYMMADLVENPELHPLGRWQKEGFSNYITLFVYKFQTVLNSDQLAVICQLPTKEFSGYYIDQYVEFDTSSRVRSQLKQPITIGDICVASRKDHIIANNQYTLEKNDFTRHALIIGITGGGKTNTSKSILDTLWNPQAKEERVPFMVIESAKREYWELRNLKGFEDLLVFTLGDEASDTAVKYRINPFETNPQISLQTHIDYLLSTFKAAFDLYAPMPYILESAVYAIYADRGWDIIENVNRYGLTQYPTLSDLYHKIDVVVEDMGYHQEVQSNVKAALQARIYSLMIGGKGAMLNTPKSVPIEALLSRPVIMELEDLGDDETKSFVIGILMVQLYEYRKAQMTKGSKALSHILMIEEAHRLLKHVPAGGDGGNTRAKSVEFFCNLLAEIRTYGQGIIVADQIPTKLASDTIKNTNLKIVHRTVALEDREAIGRAMNMTGAQIDYLSSLRRGYAAIYAEGDNRPKCVKLPLVHAYYEKDRQEVIREVKGKVAHIASGYDTVITHHIGCSLCEQPCQYYQKIKDHIDTKISVTKVVSKFSDSNYAPKTIDTFFRSELMKPLQLTNKFECICALGHMLDQKSGLTDGRRQEIIANYLKYMYK